ncbi:hypothetical protein CDCA_CDCA03G1063 [Cyanidium caldarium]|uniref:Uncharacterized protein n=1 Tax=Cyanidium caldarium TaxID=2771 RepID=A0AAV9IT40_CYACA|nr:hypothetical protein CDCA_CDCA03G1063 [Cyanidium caldarium]
MGGGEPRFPYPKQVWSPAGGWWPYPRAWKRNTAVAMGAIFLLSIPVFIVTERLQERPRPHPLGRIPWRPSVQPAPGYEGKDE